MGKPLVWEFTLQSANSLLWKNGPFFFDVYRMQLSSRRLWCSVANGSPEGKRRLVDQLMGIFTVIRMHSSLFDYRASRGIAASSTWQLEIPDPEGWMFHCQVRKLLLSIEIKCCCVKHPLSFDDENCPGSEVVVNCLSSKPVSCVHWIWWTGCKKPWFYTLQILLGYSIESILQWFHYVQLVWKIP